MLLSSDCCLLMVSGTTSLDAGNETSFINSSISRRNHVLSHLVFAIRGEKQKTYLQMLSLTESLLYEMFLFGDSLLATPTGFQLFGRIVSRMCGWQRAFLIGNAFLNSAIWQQRQQWLRFIPARKPQIDRCPERPFQIGCLLQHHRHSVNNRLHFRSVT